MRQIELTIEAQADRYYAAIAWLSSQAELKMWLIHHGAIRTAMKVETAVETHLSMWNPYMAEFMRKTYAYSIKDAHNKLMKEEH